MVKAKMFIDMDSTSINSIQAFCDTYNELYINHPDFVPADPDAVITWNAKEQSPFAKTLTNYFPIRYSLSSQDRWTNGQFPSLKNYQKHTN